MTALREGPFDPADPEFVADPYARFAPLRERAAVHEHPGLGMRVAVTHAACSRALRDRRFARVWSDAEPADAFPAFNRIHRTNLLAGDAGHDRLRAAASVVFGRAGMSRLRPIVRRRAAELVAAFAGRLADGPHADLLAGVADPLSVGVIAEWLGFPAADRELLRPWSNAIVKMYEPGVGPDARRAAERAAAEFAGYVDDLVRHRGRHPADDTLGALLSAGLTGDELVANYILLLMAGHEASVNALGNAAVALHRNPAQWRLLRDELAADPVAVETAADELLRYDTPNQLFERTALAEAELAGVRFAPGERIGLLLGAANRDPAVFPDADALDLRRHPNRHLALGAGMHYCLGAALARTELAGALTELAVRLPRFDLAAAPRRRPEYVIRGFASVELTAG